MFWELQWLIFGLSLRNGHKDGKSAISALVDADYFSSGDGSCSSIPLFVGFDVLEWIFCY
jgi:hypothetical protein